MQKPPLQVPICAFSKRNLFKWPSNWCVFNWCDCVTKKLGWGKVFFLTLNLCYTVISSLKLFVLVVASLFLYLWTHRFFKSSVCTLVRILFMGIGGDDCFVFITHWKPPSPILIWAVLLDGNDTVKNVQVSFSPHLTHDGGLRNS